MKIKVYARTNKVGSRVEQEVEIDDDLLEGMDDDERSDYLNESANDVLINLIEWGWEEVDER